MGQFSRAVRDWDAEVDGVAAGLVEDGSTPFEARIRAQRIVQERRRRRAAVRMQDESEELLKSLLAKQAEKD